MPCRGEIRQPRDDRQRKQRQPPIVEQRLIAGGPRLKPSLDADRRRQRDARLRKQIDDLERSVTVRGRKEIALLKGVTFAVAPGELVAIVGPSGAGKTMLLEAMAGVAPTSAGSVRFDGVDLHANLRKFRVVIGYVPQDDIIHADLPLQNTLRYAARLRLPSDRSPVSTARRARHTLCSPGTAQNSLWSTSGNRFPVACSR